MSRDAEGCIGAICLIGFCMLVGVIAHVAGFPAPNEEQPMSWPLAVGGLVALGVAGLFAVRASRRLHDRRHGHDATKRWYHHL